MKKKHKSKTQQRLKKQREKFDLMHELYKRVSQYRNVKPPSRRGNDSPSDADRTASEE